MLKVRLTIWSILFISILFCISSQNFVNSNLTVDRAHTDLILNDTLNEDLLNEDLLNGELTNDLTNNDPHTNEQLIDKNKNDDSLNKQPSVESDERPSDADKASAKNDPDSSIDEKEDKEDVFNRVLELFNEESDTEVLDEKSMNLANGFENFNDEVVKIYREQLTSLRENPESIWVNKTKMKEANITAMQQNHDPIFYNWYAFSLTIQKIVFSLTHSLSGKFIENSDLTLSPKCMLAMLVALDELKKQKLWVVRMLDTTGKAEFHNILDGSIISLGGYDTCLGIQSPKILRGDPGVIHGKYCLVKYDIPLPVRPERIGIKTQLFNFTNTKMEGTAIEDFSSFAHALYEHKPRIGFCIPSQCQKSDLQTMLNMYFKNSTMSSHVDYCYSTTDYPELSNFFTKLLTMFYIPIEEMNCLQKLILTAYFTIIGFVVIGTVIDLWVDAMEEDQMIRINQISEHNLKHISSYDCKLQRSFDQSKSISRYLPTPSIINSPAMTGNYSEESPFFKKCFEMKGLDADARRRLFRSPNSNLSTQLSKVPQPTSPVIPENIHQFIIPDNIILFNYWTISKRNKILRTFIAFSIYSNGIRLFKTTTNQAHALDSLHGIRVISMLWIILTHTYLLPIKSTMFYSRKFLHVSESYLFQFIVNGCVLVDSFFFIGSLLVTLNALRTLNRTNGRINLFRIVLSRFIRISPSLWLILSLIFILPVFVRGPLLNEYMQSQLGYCENGWWLNVLFINNWFPIEKICMLHTWYLSADFQMHTVSLLLILVVYKWPKIGCFISVIGIIGSCLGTFIFTYKNNHPPTVVFSSPIEIETLQSAAEIYTVTFPHISPYCLGTIAGFFLSKKRNYKINGFVVFIAWITSISMAFGILMWTQKWNRGEPWTPLSSAMYAGSHRFLWALVLFWIIFACSTSHGGFINSFLGWEFFKFLSKLSFPTYLIHFLVIWARLSYGRYTLGFSHYTMVCEYVINVVFSLLGGIIIYLFIELPSINLYNVYFQGSFGAFTMRINKPADDKNPASGIKNSSSFWFS